MGDESKSAIVFLMRQKAIGGPHSKGKGIAPVNNDDENRACYYITLEQREQKLQRASKPVGCSVGGHK